MKKLSIIVPIYNIENYIEECVNSIIRQDYHNYELLLIDDGSTDDSGIKCDEIGKNDNRIKVIHKTNGGLSDARNTGIDNSSGEYIMFIDGDDYLYDEKCLSKIVKCLEENNSDVIQYKMVYYYENKNKYVYNSDLIFLEKNKKQYLEILNKNGQISVSACDKVIKRSIIKKNNIYFEKGLLSEDVKWSYHLYLVTKSITTLNENVYVYRQQRENSISTTRSEKNAHDLFKIITYWINYDYGDEKIKNQYMNLISYWYLIFRVNYKSSYYTEEMKKSIKKLDKTMIKYDQNYKVKKAHNLSKIIGLDLTMIVMKIYIYLKNKGIIKL